MSVKRQSKTTNQNHPALQHNIHAISKEDHNYKYSVDNTPVQMELQRPQKRAKKDHDVKMAKQDHNVKMAQYNIWFNEFEMEKRTKAICNIIITNNIKIATFQEVTERSLTTLRQTLREYNFFRQRNCKYFVTTIVHKSIPAKDKKFHPFTSTTMARGMLTIKVQPFQQPFQQPCQQQSDQPQRWITIGNCHLESPTMGNPNNKSRTEQLQQCKQIIKTNETSGGLIMGDFNW